MAGENHRATIVDNPGFECFVVNLSLLPGNDDVELAARWTRRVFDCKLGSPGLRGRRSLRLRGQRYLEKAAQGQGRNKQC